MQPVSPEKSTTSSNLFLRVIRLKMFVRPVRILDIRNLKELIRIRAAHSQSRTDTFAVLLLALEANGLGLVLLPRLVSVERVVSVLGVSLRWCGLVVERTACCWPGLGLSNPLRPCRRRGPRGRRGW